MSHQTPRESSLSRHLRRFQGGIGLVAVFLLACLFGRSHRGDLVFIRPDNLTDILRDASEKGILAVGMTFVILTAGIDLSVGRILALACMLTGHFLMVWQWPALAVIALVLGAGLAMGFLNGLIVTRGRLQPFVVTLATMLVFYGLAKLVTGGPVIGMSAAPAGFQVLAGELFAGVRVPIVVFLGSVVAGELVLRGTVFGRFVYAVGGNEVAARFAGVPVSSVKAWVYAISGLLSALAGVLHCAQYKQADPNVGAGYELDAIAAVVIGGTNLMGGRGSVLGTMAGVLIVGIIDNILQINGIDPNLQKVIKGAIILGAALLQRRKGQS
ncbi:MAG: ABC transporter permease [Planctomycetota bacterium]